MQWLQDQGARARPALGACATRTGNAVNMLTDERRSNQLKKRHPGSDPGAASRCSSTYWPRTALRCARHCRLSARQSFRQSSQILRDAWMRAPTPQPAAHHRTVAGRDARTCVSSYRMGRAWHVRKNEGGLGFGGKHAPPYFRVFRIVKKLK